MSTEKINPRFVILIVMMVIVASMRVPNAAQVTPWANFTPIGAMGLFGGAYFNSTWKKFALPLLTLLLSDLLISQFVYDGKYGLMYGGWYWIYGIFAGIVLLGGWLLRKVSINLVLRLMIAAADIVGIFRCRVFAVHGFTFREMNRLHKNRAVKYERVKLAILTTWINAGRQVQYKLLIYHPATKTFVEESVIYANDDCFKPEPEKL